MSNTLLCNETLGEFDLPLIDYQQWEHVLQMVMDEAVLKEDKDTPTKEGVKSGVHCTLYILGAPVRPNATNVNSEQLYWSGK